jgi:acetoacetate decarboxylase
MPYTMPDVSPLYPPLPYRYHGYRKLTVVARAAARDLAAILPEPFELSDDRFEVFFMDAPKVDGLRPYAEAGLVVQCRYRDRIGGHVAFEYVTTDDSLAAGREIWGYPKKIATVKLWDEAGKTYGTCSREGMLLAAATFAPGRPQFDSPVMHPRLQVKRIPPAELGRGPAAQIIWNELTEVVTESLVWGDATLELGHALGDELSALQPIEILGAQIVVGDFLLGYGQIVESL